jgi:hypothetical protein
MFSSIGQDIIRTLIDDGVSNIGLTPHCINADFNWQTEQRHALGVTELVPPWTKLTQVVLPDCLLEAEPDKSTVCCLQQS